jgi:hypothetical protein
MLIEFHVVQLAIPIASCHQIAMLSSLDNPTFFHDQDEVCVDDCLKIMCNQ